MNDLVSAPGELHFTVQVTRKDTGKVETFEMVGKVLPEPVEQKEVVENVSNA